MNYTQEDVKRINKEIGKMYSKNWLEMYFDEQQEALKKDKKHNYIHILLKLSHDWSDYARSQREEWREKWKKQIELKWELIGELEDKYQKKYEELEEKIEELKKGNKDEKDE